MAENGINDGNKSERNEKGQFVKGNQGGPGRSNTSIQSLSLEDIERALAKDLKSRDPKIRHPATRLLLTLKKLQGSRDTADSAVINPVVLKIVSKHIEELIDDGSIVEADVDFIDWGGVAAGGTGRSCNRPWLHFLQHAHTHG